ncbi:LuxR C-terminal-related transcriptional regulator [Streptomyces sp. MB09-01]|uniref:LuxR C-terminal-related transcriptional regulator n=1 Tax=Streptomyces sp. MB09-01 TaxID=3028666 RepID=UPI0029A74EC4|nr:LuxR C-terminal-related transcriptional regulator [Streptomyces sp. MB09-01]MDX3534610.1 LuxR C-terminal-related transcriptional regulator [Streptomyces sp. MB09-01]
MLSALGLDTSTEAVYRLLAARPEGWGVGQMAERLGLEEQHVRDALDRLAELSLLRRSADRPGGWRAIHPELGLQLLLRRQQDELERRRRELDETHVAVTRMIADIAGPALGVAGEGGSDETDSERLIGMDAIQSRLEQIADKAAASVCTFMPGGGHSAASIEAARHNDAQILLRGVEVRTVCLDSVRNSAPTLEYARWLTESGGEVRTVPSLPLRMILIDGASALVPLDPSDTRRGAVLLHAAGAMTALSTLFEQVWAVALPLGAQQARDEGTGLTVQERELLTLLAKGLTDETAAGRLGVSLSTVRRSMASIMERLGARSRFEAGLRAAQAGWL